MSSVSGLFRKDGQAVDRAILDVFIDSIQFSKPDTTSIYQHQKVGLAQSQIFFTPHDSLDALPFCLNDGAPVVTGDIRLDNRVELMGRLGVSEHGAPAYSDAHLIALAYQKWEMNSFQYLKGAFALVIYDPVKSTLLCVRDHGIRPLFYNDSAQFLGFSTVVSTLLKAKLCAPQLNEQTWASLLLNPAWSVNDTFHEEIKMIPPLHYLLVDACGNVTLTEYFSYDSLEPLKFNSRSDYYEQFAEVFQTSVSAMLRSNTKVAAHLSGGLDSSSVTCQAAALLKAQNQSLQAFTHYPHLDFMSKSPHVYVDESPYIGSILSRFDNIVDNPVFTDDQSFFTGMEYQFESFGIPVMNPVNGIWMEKILRTLQEQNIQTVLTGQRGNFSISWSGRIFVELALQQKYREFLTAFSEVKQFRGISSLRMIASILRSEYRLAYPMILRHEINSLSTFASKDLLGKTKARQIAFEQATELLQSFQSHFSTLKEIYNGRMATFLPMLENSMRLKYRIDQRDPTAHRDVLEFCLRAPRDLFVHEGRDRLLVREGLKEVVPELIRNRQSRGLQGADWSMYLTRDRMEFDERLQRLVKDPFVNQFIDTGKLYASFTKWTPAKDKKHWRYSSEYRSRLMRAVNWACFFEHYKQHFYD